MNINREELETLMEEAAKKGAKAYTEEQRKEKRKKQKKNKFHDTYSLMSHYRDAVFHIENAVSEGSQVAAGDFLTEKEDMYLRSIRRTKFRTMIITAHIDKAIDEMERRRREQGREIEFKAFEMYFMEGLDYKKIAEELNTGKNTPKRWVDGILNELSVLLWGIEVDE